MKRDYEYIVLGLGGLGSGAAYWLSRTAGAEVLGIEQFELGHVRGESQDHSRIIRLSYHTPEYVELARLAYDAWNTLQRESGEQVVLKTGGLDFARHDSKIPLDTYRHAMSACNVEYEDIDADEIMRRWPQFTLSDDIEGLYQEQSGIAMAARANEAHRKMARANGASLIDKTPVTNISTRGDEVTVETSGGTFRCGKLVIAAGPWSNRALGYL
ncbi:MAG: FAD-dependent oxidoreductase, partial [Gemmatimonas sp.]